MLYTCCHYLPIELPTISRNAPQFLPDISFLNLLSCFISFSVLGVEKGLTAEASTPSHTQSLSILFFWSVLVKIHCWLSIKVCWSSQRVSFFCFMTCCISLVLTLITYAINFHYFLPSACFWLFSPLLVLRYKFRLLIGEMCTFVV